MNIEEAFRTLVKENLNLRVYSKDIEDELKEVIKTNEMLENENNDLEIKMKKEPIQQQNNNITNNNGNEVEIYNQILTKINDFRLSMMQSVLNYIINLNTINEEIISEQGIEHYFKITENLISEVTKIYDKISENLLQNTLEDEIKKNIELELFKYKNNYTFNINGYINTIRDLKHNISSLKKEKDVLNSENKQLKALNHSRESDMGDSKSLKSETQSITSVSSDYTDNNSLYEIGSENNIKNSKFSKLTNSAKKIIKNTSNKKLFKDKKTRSRGFSVSFPIRPVENTKEENNKRRNSIIESSTLDIPKAIPHVFVPHSYIKPTKCEICQDICWRKEVRCKTCGYRCHERCQAEAEKVTSCIVNKVQKANMISEMEPQKKLFGTTISTYGINEIDYIPSIVKCCISEVEKRGLKIEGIYRKTGNVIKTRNLVKAFDNNESPDISENGEFPDIPVITSTLKQYFRDLPDALIPERFFDNIKEIIDIDDEYEQIHKMKDLVEKLPRTNYETLKYLCIHLNKVDANSKFNLMTSKNLGVVFGPTLIGESKKHNKNNQNNMISTVSRVRAIDLLIRCAKKIFNYIPELDKNHISMDMLEDLENTINEKQISIDETVERNNESNFNTIKSNKSDKIEIIQINLIFII